MEDFSKEYDGQEMTKSVEKMTIKVTSVTTPEPKSRVGKLLNRFFVRLRSPAESRSLPRNGCPAGNELPRTPSGSAVPQNSANGASPFPGKFMVCEKVEPKVDSEESGSKNEPMDLVEESGPKDLVQEFGGIVIDGFEEAADENQARKTEVAGLMGEVKGVTDKLSGLEVNVSGVDSEVQVLKQDVKVLREEKIVLTAKVSRLELEVGGLKEEKNGLVAKVSGLESEVLVLKEEAKLVREEKNMLSGKVTGLENQVKLLKEKNSGLEKELSDMKAEAVTFYSRFAKMEQEAEKQREDYNSLMAVHKELLEKMGKDK